MKQGFFTGLLIVVTYVVSLGFYVWMGTTPPESIFHAIWKGGPVVSVLMSLIHRRTYHCPEEGFGKGKYS
jgi:biopolymer transport protein ExbB